MKGVPGLVEQGRDVVQHPDRVHEDERPAPEMQRLAVAARRLALPAVEIQQLLVRHGLELPAKAGPTPLEHPPAGGDQLGRGAEGAERLAALRVGPRSQGRSRSSPSRRRRRSMIRSTAGATTASTASWKRRSQRGCSRTGTSPRRCSARNRGTRRSGPSGPAGRTAHRRCRRVHPGGWRRPRCPRKARSRTTRSGLWRKGCSCGRAFSTPSHCTVRLPVIRW